MPPPVSLRTIVYVDGFNFYYGVLKGTPYRWLDLEKFYTLLRPHDQIQSIKFFTALVDPGPHRDRQDTLLSALRACAPAVEVILGRFKLKQVDCSRCTSRWLQPEEKRTDVNIGIHMIDDAHRGRCERQVVVSGDSDPTGPCHAMSSLVESRHDGVLALMHGPFLRLWVGIGSVSLPIPLVMSGHVLACLVTSGTVSTTGHGQFSFRSGLRRWLLGGGGTTT